MENVVYDEFPQWFLVAETVSIVMLLLLTVVSFLLYFVEIQILFSFRKTKFQGPFYRLMFAGILCDIISALNLFFGQIIPARAWFSDFYFSNENLLGAIFYTITYGGRCVQGATATILSFCRVSAVCAPMLYRKLGEPKYMYTMQSLQLVGALAAVCLLMPKGYEYVNQNGGYYSAFSDNSFRKPFYLFVAVLEVLFVLCIVVNNLVTYCTYRVKFGKKKRSNSVTGTQYLVSRDKQKQESSLDKMTFIVCLVELIYFAFVVYSLQINQSMNKRVFYFLYNILCVVYSTFSAWMLLIFSKPIALQFRERFTRFTGLKASRSFSISVQNSHGQK